MNEIKEKTKEVQSYKDLCECLDTELGKEKDELGIVTEAYQRAKTKGYMWVPPKWKQNPYKK